MFLTFKWDSFIVKPPAGIHLGQLTAGGLMENLLSYNISVHLAPPNGDTRHHNMDPTTYFMPPQLKQSSPEVLRGSVRSLLNCACLKAGSDTSNL